MFQPQRYRPDIDGLRAVAVMSVLAFHYGAPLPGGFTGVDVFFVISGFLITSKLNDDIKAGEFSILGFYDRRIRRILPALLVMLGATLLAGYILLMPEEYTSLAASTAMAAFGISNFYFLTNTGYFDQAADLLPLLHTWSLAVEEQFYLVWPLALFAMVKAGRGTSAILAGVVIAGFAASLWWLDYDVKSAFYMSPPRAWELAIGALLVFLPPLSRRLGELAALGGLILIAAGFVLVSNKSFPGVAALYPCVGAALVIWPRQMPTASSKWLGYLSPIGLISYSLYLWHWPVWVLFRIYINGGQPSIPEAAALAVLSILLAVLSYRFVEQPFRRRRWNPARSVTTGLFACALVCCGAAYVHSYDGFPSRISPDVLGMRGLGVMWQWPCEERKIADAIPASCTTGAPWTEGTKKAALWGDSMVEQFMPYLSELATERKVSIMTFMACPAILDGDRTIDNYDVVPNYAAFCADKRKVMLDFLRTSTVELVILAASWDILKGRLVGKNQAIAFRDGLSDIVGEIVAMNKKVAIIATVPQWSSDPVSCALLSVGVLRRNCASDQLYRTKSQYENQTRDTVQAMLEVKNKYPGLTIVVPGERLCASGECINRIGNEFIYRDIAHLRRNLSPSAIRELARIMGLDRVF
jgi:peptidoglycan/LPS O-acetylase OafA/YrhL